MKTDKNKGIEVWKTLKFQYEPLEKKFLKLMVNTKQTEILAQYKKANYLTKIRVLDQYAQFIGL